MRVGRFLVQGVDVWLNNPRRPLEASGTSGMKAAQNGVPNLSVLDGWWDEGYDGDNGWAIGGRETNPDEAAQDWADAQDLYRLLEERAHPALLRARRGGHPAALGRASCAARWRRRCGASRRRGCSTSTRSSCTCRRPACTVARPTSPEPRQSTEAGLTRRGARHLARARAPQPSAGRQLRLGLRRGLRAGLRADGRRPSSGIRGVRLSLHYTGPLLEWLRAERPGLHRPAARAGRTAARSRSSAAATTSRSSPRCRSATASASCAGWATSSSAVRTPAARRLAGGARLGAGPADLAGRRPATAGRSSTTRTSAPRRSPRTTCGGRTRPRTRAGCCASSGPSRACATGSRSATSRRSSATCASTPPRTATASG